MHSLEEHKRRVVLHLVNRSEKPMWQFVGAVEEVADEVLAAYSDLDEEWQANKATMAKGGRGGGQNPPNNGKFVFLAPPLHRMKITWPTTRVP